MGKIGDCMFITFEGIDGSGKTTQLQMLSEYLKEKGYDVMVLREPGGITLSENIREMLLNSKENIHPITELLLFESSRSHLVHNVINPALESGKVIICDRFYDSTTAYQGYGRGIELKLIHQFNKIATLGIIPDITFYLDVDLETAKIRSERRIYDRIEKSGNEFYSKVVDGFRELAKKNSSRIKLIEANGEIEDTQMKIRKIVNTKFLSKAQKINSSK